MDRAVPPIPSRYRGEVDSSARHDGRPRRVVPHASRCSSARRCVDAEPGAQCPCLPVSGRRQEGEIGEFDAVRAKRPTRLPTVLSQAEVRRVLAAMELGGMHGLMARLVYSSGLRLVECCTLRVMDADLERGQVVVRAGKGSKDRTTMLPTACARPSPPRSNVSVGDTGKICSVAAGESWSLPLWSTSDRPLRGNSAGSFCSHLTGASETKPPGAGRDGTCIRARSPVP